ISLSLLIFFFYCFSCYVHLPHLHSFPTRRSSDLAQFPLYSAARKLQSLPRKDTIDDDSAHIHRRAAGTSNDCALFAPDAAVSLRSEEHTSELQSLAYLVCRLLLEKKKKKKLRNNH